MTVATLVAGQLTSAPEERKTKDGRTMVQATVKARIGRDGVQHVRLIAYSPAARNALLGFKLGEFVSAQGVPNVTAQRVSGDIVLTHTLFPEVVIGLRPNGGLDDQLA